MINAAGLAAAQIAALVGDESFAIRPRKGQLIVIDPAKAPPINTILLPTPSPTTKGILITPAAHGNLLLGPTAEDGDDLDDWATTPVGLAQVLRGVQRLVPSLQCEAAITQYAGSRSVGYERTGDQLRPASDYIIRPAVGCPNLIHVAGIRSTGLSAAPAIAAYIAEWVGAGRHSLPAQASVMQETRPATEPLADIPSSPKNSPDHLICSCSGVGLDQARAVIHTAPIAQTLDALKRRMWCMAGPCQGAGRIADPVALLANELAVPLDSIRKHANGSEILVKAWPTPRQVSAIVPAGREQHRGDLLIGGTRPAGVYSAGATMRLLAYGRPGSHAVLLGNAPGTNRSPPTSAPMASPPSPIPPTTAPTTAMLPRSSAGHASAPSQRRWRSTRGDNQERRGYASARTDSNQARWNRATWTSRWQSTSTVAEWHHRIGHGERALS